MITQKTVLVSFVGANDKGDIPGKGEGAILTIFTERKYDETILLWCNTNKKGLDLKEVALKIKKTIEIKELSKEVTVRHFPCRNVTDHNEIYPRLLKELERIRDKQELEVKLTAAISSGTPSMQACWLLIAESGDFPLELVRSDEPGFGKPYVKPVKLGSLLPRILSQKQEIVSLKKENLNLIPKLHIISKTGKVIIGTVEIELSPMEFAYYRLFAERTKAKLEPVILKDIRLPVYVKEKVHEYFIETFPEAKSSILSKEVRVGHLRKNVSEINRKIREAKIGDALIEYFSIKIKGHRGSKEYFLNTPVERIYLKH